MGRPDRTPQERAAGLEKPAQPRGGRPPGRTRLKTSRGSLGQALTAAMQSNINDPGGCNAGFLRKDALLMVTFISTTSDSKQSEGTPDTWAQAVIDAKHGDDKSVVMLNIGYFYCDDSDRLCQVTKLFPFHHLASVLADSYGPAFVEAASLVDTAWAGFVPPG